MILFAAYTAAKTPNDFQWAGQSPKISPYCGGISTPSNTWFLGPPKVSLPNRISIGSAVFCRAHECDQQKDWQIDSDCSKRPHLAIAAMRPNNYSWYKRRPAAVDRLTNKYVETDSNPTYGAQLLLAPAALGSLRPPPADSEFPTELATHLQRRI